MISWVLTLSSLVVHHLSSFAPLYLICLNPYFVKVRERSVHWKDRIVFFLNNVGGGNFDVLSNVKCILIAIAIFWKLFCTKDFLQNVVLLLLTLFWVWHQKSRWDICRGARRPLSKYFFLFFWSWKITF